jgi:hypothetical protein
VVAGRPAQELKADATGAFVLELPLDRGSPP